MYYLSTYNYNHFYEAAKLKVDPMSDKYPSLSPYVYCANNPVKLVDPNGEEVGPIWPKRGVNTYSWKVKAGAGDGYGVAYSIMGGISLDRHGKLIGWLKIINI